ncbi:RING finger domain-containing protein [Histoplasma capsulatum var. duboisii H88]|uniref:RING finger domain-containing protein n=1 Tax=Ajellomyces capsulatus (strain H88) TaxID=544711 RepID=F0UMA8_AJEC8|nr:RING finger domain-containing protein [Histoplasma capsulatum var. duboisii H88]QSS54244.1 RING finger domain-containing protein [Histoplasma capsulatum var. duboisii H88]
MSSGPGQSSVPSKAINIPSQPSQSFQVASNPGIETASQRRTSAFLGAGSSSKNLSSPRNHQTRKNQHKRHRRPRLDDEDVFAESAAMKSTMSRKGQTSITHLMNFSLPPRPQQNLNGYSRGPRRNNAWGPRSGYHAVDKARYVHANYRFIVNPKNSYHAQATNADVHLDWNSVLQVLVSTDTQATSCPICLSTPIAPRMAKCGHVFCLPCVIRYMHSTDESNPLPEKKARWKKCPICWDTVYISDIRPVGWYRGQTDTPAEGGDVVLRLVMRHPGSTLALPRDGVEKSLGLDDDIPWYHVAEVPDYARIMKGGEDYMISQYDNEIQDLLRQAQEDELLFGDDSTWTRKAVAAIREAKEKVKDIGNPPIPPRQPPERHPTRIPIKFEQPPDGVPEMYKIRHATKPGQTLPNNAHTPSNPTPTARNTFPNHDQLDDVSVAISKLEVNQTLEMQNQRTHSNLGAQSKTAGKARDASGAPHPPDHPFYFYQALPHFYLSSLDIRILKAAFGDYSQFPSTILPRIERISTGHIVDEDLRKRTKYLGHLPYGCEVSFLECDWRDLVGSDVLQQFSGDIERRRKRNREKAAQEEKERIRAEKNEEEQRWASARRKRPSVSAADRPFSENDFQPLGFEASSSAPGFDPTMSSASPPWSSSRGRNRPSFTALASPSGSPPDSSAATTAGPTLHRTVWGTAAIAPTSPQATYRNPDREPNDGWLQDWERELMVEQEHKILAATTNIDSNGPRNSTNATGTGTTGGKKKKNKKITLMSTTARRAA